MLVPKIATNGGRFRSGLTKSAGACATGTATKCSAEWASIPACARLNHRQRIGQVRAPSANVLTCEASSPSP